MMLEKFAVVCKYHFTSRILSTSIGMKFLRELKFSSLGMSLEVISCIGFVRNKSLISTAVASNESWLPELFHLDICWTVIVKEEQSFLTSFAIRQ